MGLHMGIESVAHTARPLFLLLKEEHVHREQPHKWRHRLTWCLVPPGRCLAGLQDPAQVVRPVCCSASRLSRPTLLFLSLLDTPGRLWAWAEWMAEQSLVVLLL